MPPTLDTPEEVAAMLAALLGVLGVVGAGIITAVAGLVVAWRAKIKPLLTETKDAAEHAATQLTPNHGSSAKDSLARIERAVSDMDRNNNQRFADLRADMRTEREATDRKHSEIFRRLHALESPPREDTIP